MTILQEYNNPSFMINQQIPMYHVLQPDPYLPLTGSFSEPNVITYIEQPTITTSYNLRFYNKILNVICCCTLISSTPYKWIFRQLFLVWCFVKSSPQDSYIECCCCLNLNEDNNKCSDTCTSLCGTSIHGCDFYIYSWNENKKLLPVAILVSVLTWLIKIPVILLGIIGMIILICAIISFLPIFLIIPIFYLIKYYYRLFCVEECDEIFYDNNV